MKQRIERLEQELAELKKQLDETEVEVGGWVKTDAGDILKITDNNYQRKYPNDICVVGFGLWLGESWRDEHNPLYITKSEVTKATPEEIESALIEEAKRRGFPCNSWKFNSVVFYGHIDENWQYVKQSDTLTSFEGIVYRQGKWAEIIEEKTKVFDWDVEKINSDITIGCEQYDRKFLSKLKYHLEYVKGKTVAEVLNELEKLDL